MFEEESGILVHEGGRWVGTVSKASSNSSRSACETTRRHDTARETRGSAGPGKAMHTSFRGGGTGAQGTHRA